MTNAMGPPPPRNAAAMGPPPPRNPPPTFDAPPNTTTVPELESEPEPQPEPSAPEKTTPMGPPPSMTIDLPISDSDQDISQSPPIPESEQSNPPPQSTEDVAEVSSSSIDPVNAKNDKQQQQHRPNVAVPYKIPPWSEPPCHHYFLEVLKGGSIVDQFDVYEKGAYMFGRVDLCDFVLDHPTISRFHAVLQFRKTGGAYIYDLGSTHGTFINKNQVQKKVYMELHVGDVLKFGHSSRLYIFQGPPELMRPEGDLKSIKTAKVRREMHDMEASLLRAKREASLADGISWGMDEDAVEELEDDLEEITWQTYKGQLTEKQEKTREKVLKRLEKIANMKKEIDAIRAKDISQGGLTQGQQTQIARNEQRMSQIVEELENLEETLNESIRESMGARGGKMSRGKKKGATEDDEDEYMSDDDDFYDRTRKKSSKQKEAEKASVETADSLLDKKDNLIKEIDDKRKLLVEEKDKGVPQIEAAAEAADELDAYMSGISSQLVIDKTEKIQKEVNALQSELERVLYLLKIADPTGEAAKRRESRAHEEKTNVPTPASVVAKRPSVEQKKRHEAVETANDASEEPDKENTTMKSSCSPDELEVVADTTKSKPTVYTVNKPQWLGAVDKKKETTQKQEVTPDLEESDQFVDYKDRKEVLGKLETAQENMDSGLENAAPGLIIRKRKQPVEDSDVSKVKDSEQSSSAAGVEIRAEDAVALLLKHTRGIQALDDAHLDSSDMEAGKRAEKGKKKPKRVLGPEKPSFLDSESDYQSWVPPEGQSGDGRTSLNDRYGY